MLQGLGPLIRPEHGTIFGMVAEDEVQVEGKLSVAITSHAGG